MQLLGLGGIGWLILYCVFALVVGLYWVLLLQRRVNSKEIRANFARIF
jgi:uncharacterized membrane protein